MSSFYVEYPGLRVRRSNVVLVTAFGETVTVWYPETLSADMWADILKTALGQVQNMRQLVEHLASVAGTLAWYVPFEFQYHADEDRLEVMC